MLLYRLGRRRYARSLTGVGAALYPGRWNSEHVPMIYCGSSGALCALEVLVHIDRDRPPLDIVISTLIVPDEAPMYTPGRRQLPRGWVAKHYSTHVQEFGDRFIHDKKHLVLRVPSAVVPSEFNYLLNPLHPEIDNVKVSSVVPFTFDTRLFRTARKHGSR